MHIDSIYIDTLTTCPPFCLMPPLQSPPPSGLEAWRSVLFPAAPSTHRTYKSATSQPDHPGEANMQISEGTVVPPCQAGISRTRMLRGLTISLNYLMSSSNPEKLVVCLRHMTRQPACPGGISPSTVAVDGTSRKSKCDQFGKGTRPF